MSGAKRDIYLLLGKLVQQGKAVIMISSEIPELMGVHDRIMVMCEGNLSGEVQRGAFSQETHHDTGSPRLKYKEKREMKQKKYQGIDQ